MTLRRNKRKIRGWELKDLSNSITQTIYKNKAY